jgi:DNA topoisomerase VI subunit B
MTTTFKREPFKIDRTAEFFTEKELSMQLGQGRAYWPAAVLKELIDNALDAAENAGIAPQVKVIVEDDAVTVADNGPGLPVEVYRYTALNPHASFHLQLPDRCLDMPATGPGWEKWRPDQPTSPHWYTPETLRALVAGHVAGERNQAATPKTVRAFVAEFAGLQGSTKPAAVLKAAGLTGEYLHDLVAGDDVDMDKVKRLLAGMQQHSRPVQPKALGVLGEEHFKQCLSQQFEVEPDSIRYKRALGTVGRMPFAVEVGFGIHTERASSEGPTVMTGLNWSPLLRPSLPQVLAMLGENRVDRQDPVVVLIHLAFPRFGYTDHGKGNLALPATVIEEVQRSLRLATASWKDEKRQADRQDRLSELALERLRKAGRRMELSIRQAASQVMQEAYMKASANGTLPANARQIMYAARPLVLNLPDGRCWKNSSYFTQHLLPDFINLHPDLTEKWDVVFDARGRLMEPHTGRRIDLGTLQVRRYIAGWNNTFAEDVSQVRLDHACPTAGPGNRYTFALFVEKEGFTALLDHAAIADRYDLAIMSTKGMSVTAARQLVERLSEQGVTVLVLRDFDKSGFSIAHTLRSDTRRYQFRTTPRVVDLGLRLEDVQAMNLESEPVAYKGNTDPRINLEESGATEEEADFLVRRETASGWVGQRVELNAMASDQFIDSLERKLQEAGVQKVVPDQTVLAAAFRRAARHARLEEAIVGLREEVNREVITVPPDLVETIRSRVAGTTKAWDDTVWELAEESVHSDRR